MTTETDVRMFDRDAVAGVSGQWSLLFVCVDELSVDGEATGRIYNCYQKDAYRFRGYADMLLGANDLFDQLGLPQAQMELRSIRPQAKSRAFKQTCTLEQYYMLPEIINRHGAVFDFCIYVRSRQNVGWQGMLTLPKLSEMQLFRSTLELLHFLREYQKLYIQAQPQEEAL